MPELLRLRTQDFEFSVWASDIQRKVDVRRSMLQKRNSALSPVDITLEPAVKADVVCPSSGFNCVSDKAGLLRTISLDQPVFFENTSYQCEWCFDDNVLQACLYSRNRVLSNAFRFIEARRGQAPRLTGNLDTGNDVGRMVLCVRYNSGGVQRSSSIVFNVQPLKIDLDKDLPAMYRMIDEVFPLWRFSFSSKTESEVSKGTRSGDFPLMWLSVFADLRRKLEKALDIIVQAPHNSYVKVRRHRRAEECDGFISQRQSERIRNDLLAGRFDRRYLVEAKRLSVDTSENRFVKMVLLRSIRRLEDFRCRIVHSWQNNEQLPVSEKFVNELTAWTIPLKKLLNTSFFREVGRFDGTGLESLVLQGRAGYRTVYQIWTELKFYLEAFRKCNTISMKSVSEIYEVWCFLTIAKILQSHLGFKLQEHKRCALELNKFQEYQLRDGMAGAFSFIRESDGIHARLCHEPVFRTYSRETRSYIGEIRSYIVSQKPDILLEVSFPQVDGRKRKFIWLFDAKYRIMDTGESDAEDLVPDDAINQMHRYRDALIHLSGRAPDVELVRKSRPVFGAFVLYPGFFDQRNEANPYNEAIKEVGIGAFALLPSDKNGSDGTLWLQRFLQDTINGVSPMGIRQRIEAITSGDPVRIPSTGVERGLYNDLMLVLPAHLRNQNGRIDVPKFCFKPKESRCMDSLRLNNIVAEIRFIAFVEASGPDGRTVSSIYAIDKCEARLDVYTFKTSVHLTLDRPVIFNNDLPMFTTLSGLSSAHGKRIDEYLYSNYTIKGRIQ